MSNFVESFTTCMWFDVNIISRRNLVAAAVSSIAFFGAWWLIIGIAATAEKESAPDFSYYICGILGTLSLVMVNTVSNEMLNGGGGYEGGICSSHGVKIWLFTGFVLGFASVIASVWLLISEFTDKLHIQGVGIVLQNFFILFASLIYKFGRTEEGGSFGGF